MAMPHLMYRSTSLNLMNSGTPIWTISADFFLFGLRLWIIKILTIKVHLNFTFLNSVTSVRVFTRMVSDNQ